MNNACLKSESEIINPTILEMMVKMDRLEQENKQLRVENIEWKDLCSTLHNYIENKENEEGLPITEDGEIGDMSYIDEYAKGNAEWDNLRIPEELGWQYEA